MNQSSNFLKSVVDIIVTKQEKQSQNNQEVHMFVSHVDVIEKKKMEHPDLKNNTKQVLIGEQEGWIDHVMRLFTMGADGHTPKHTHPWPHIIYVVEGRGILSLQGKSHELQAGSVAYVPSDEEHQFSNPHAQEFIFMCIVPKVGEM